MTTAAGQSESKPPQTLAFIPLRTVYEIVPEVAKKDVITYSKGVQTSEAWIDTRSVGDFDEEDDFEARSRRKQEDEIREELRKELEQEAEQYRKAQAEIKPSDRPKEIPVARPLQDEEARVLEHSNDFIEFLERSSRVAARALDEDYDVLADYKLIHQGGDEHDPTGSGRSGRSVREVAQFYDERWSKKRMITDIDFSPKFSELVLASYTKSPSAPYDPDGLIMVWNQHMPSRPEYRFQANSDILSARFSPFHPNLIFGGTYSGQVLLWDTRSRSPTAVQSTPLTMLNSLRSYTLDAPRAAGHSSPIYSLTFSGTQAAYSILSTSTDGTFCAWAPDMLVQPSERLQLLDPYPKSILHPANDLAPTSLALPVSSSAESHALLGTEQGGMYLIHRQDRAGGGAKAGIDSRVVYAGHSAPVMSLDFHKAVGPLDLSDLALSAGLDWNIKLWRIREPPDNVLPASSTIDYLGRNIPSSTSRSRPGTSHAQSRSTPYQPYYGAPRIEPEPALLEIQKDDAVYDAKWSPTRPAVFASVDGGGTLELWDLNENTDIPVARAWVSDRAASATKARLNKGNEHASITAISTLDAKLAPSNTGPPQGYLGNSLNKCAWEHGDGRKVAVGGLDGIVTVFEVGEALGGRKGAEVAEWEGLRRLVARCEGD